MIDLSLSNLAVNATIVLRRPCNPGAVAGIRPPRTGIMRGQSASEKGTGTLAPRLRKMSQSPAVLSSRSKDVSRADSAKIYTIC